MLSDVRSTSVRAAFPYLADRVYLDTAAVGLSWDGQGRAAGHFYDAIESRGYDARAAWQERSRRVRGRVADLLRCAPDAVAWLSCTTEGLNLAAHSIRWRRGDRVVLAADEFPSVQRAWAHAEPAGVEVVRVAVREEASREDDLLDALDARTRVLAVSHVHSVSGTRLDLARLGAACRARDALLVVDGVQALGAVPVDASQADVYCSSFFKWMLSSFGLGVLVCSARAEAQMTPGYRGYANSPDEEASSFPSRPAQSPFQYAHSNLPALYALDGTLDFLEAQGWDSIHGRVAELGAALFERLSALGLRVRTPRSSRAGIIAAEVADAGAVSRELSARGISVAERGGLLRASPHFYNDESDLDALTGALGGILRA